MIKNRRAFTLVEVLLSIVMIGAVVVCISYILILGMNSYSLVSDRRDSLQGARLAVNMMINDFQTIANPATDITSISSSAITFIAAGGGSVTYQVSGSNLLRGADVLASNLGVGSGFQYFTLNGAVTSNPAQVYRIHVSVTVNAQVAQNGTVTINSNAFLRNRYYAGFTQN